MEPGGPADVSEADPPGGEIGPQDLPKSGQKLPRDDTLLWILKNPKNFPPEMGYATPSHMGKPGEVWGVARELEETFGWTEEEIRGFLGGNLLRVYEANWR